MAKLIQRDGRPPLGDISPSETPNTAAWDETYGNLSMAPRNHPVPLRKKSIPPTSNGWDDDMQYGQYTEETPSKGDD